MTETAVPASKPKIGGFVQELDLSRDRENPPETQYVIAALENHKREGLELAVRARWIAMSIFAVFVALVHPQFEVIYHIGIMALLCLNGWFMQRVGRVGRSRMELLLIFVDLLLMTVGMVGPNPLSVDAMPLAMQYRLENFIYFFVILSVATMAYSWRTVIAIGVWTLVMWMTALALLWWFTTPTPGLTEAAADAFGASSDLFKFLDPNDFMVQLRVQEVIVFLIVAITLGVSVRRTSRLLLDNAGLERERANLSRYFSPNVVAQLSQNDEPLKQVRIENVAILFIDIVGFTRMAAGRDPHEVIALLREFHGRMEREVFRHNGTLDKYLGDGLMATFGTPTAGERDASNALDCARAMQQSLNNWNRDRRRLGEAEIKVGIGIHYGETLLGDIGANRLEYAVIGTAVNVAARLEEMTRELQAAIVMSDDLRLQALREEADGDLTKGFECHPDQAVRGLDDPMKVWAKH
ncbi:Adenylate cyclase 1 [Phaeobacter sp. CECT 5382]|uniref:adenylate/guanylate cyclase domain-containing protein n=1 Tax=Phaeobacter sp. CECT 5382 TaxID=1712645 RepID=UPI0006DA57BB|nr:adenylate/guanylate cyclase domain-containing protein [Phaeobacter sp. CECT 5382]CUH86701.1 Adenylate cyclase 1 [Phaeobacter sp. CECT 5382]